MHSTKIVPCPENKHNNNHRQKVGDLEATDPQTVVSPQLSLQILEICFLIVDFQKKFVLKFVLELWKILKFVLEQK